MNYETMQEAITEAKRFIKAAEQVPFHTVKAIDKKDYTYITTGKESGACRRASLDLTRALARMRKP